MGRSQSRPPQWDAQAETARVAVRRAAHHVRRERLAFVVSPLQLPEFAEKVLGVVEEIPPGRVMSYGDVAEYLGEGGGPRQVGRVMALWGGAVAWWRVLRADGTFLRGHEREALGRYQEEGTPLRRSVDGAALGVDMRKARWPGR
jgi:alkylated DNA nucleotide flippase Atl1